MSYVEAHTGLRDHLKTKKVARTLSIPKTQVIGHLLCLWWWCQEYAQDGDLSQFSAADIAEAAEWVGEPDVFVTALIECGVKDGPGFIGYDDDNHMRINDWFEYGGKLFIQRAQAARRMRNMRLRNSIVTPQLRVTNDNVTRTFANVTPIDKTREEERRELQLPSGVVGVVGVENPVQTDVNRCYADNMPGKVTQVIADDLANLASTYGAETVILAIQEGGRNNAKSIKYVAKVLRNWAAGDGHPPTNGSGPVTEQITVPANVAELLR